MRHQSFIDKNLFAVCMETRNYGEAVETLGHYLEDRVVDCETRLEFGGDSEVTLYEIGAINDEKILEGRMPKGRDPIKGEYILEYKGNLVNEEVHSVIKRIEEEFNLNFEILSLKEEYRKEKFKQNKI